MGKIEFRDCVICGKEFKVKIIQGGKSRKLGVGFRPKMAKTCSPKCSKDYKNNRCKNG